MPEAPYPDDAPWVSPELAAGLVRKLATGRYDALAGRYLHAEQDDLDDLLERIDELRERDLNAIRLMR
jgi:3-oxoacyl-[acyl-carrier protein] reductase